MSGRAVSATKAWPIWKRKLWELYQRVHCKTNGSTFAAFAGLSTVLFAKEARSFGYDRSANEYFCDGPIPHRFAHKGRMKNFLHGTMARGRQLGDEYLLAHISFENDDIIVDCGANIGDIGLYFAQLKTNVQIIAFEPSPVEYKALLKNLDLNPYVKVLSANNVALWETTAKGLDFYIKSETGDSSLIEINYYDQKVTVPCYRLDEVLERRSYRLLKLEAEGAEPEILRGATGVLDCFEYVSVDAGFERGVQQESTAPEVCRFLLEYGFQLVDLNPIRLTLLFRRIDREGKTETGR